MTQPQSGGASASEALSPSQRSKIRRLSQPKEPEPGDEAGELNIVPYLDIIMNVLVFVLASVSVTFLTQLDTTPPSSGGKGVKNAIDMDALNLAVIIVDEGVSFKTSFGNIAPGCGDEGGSVRIGKGLTIPNRGDKFDYDLAGIRRCARALKTIEDGKFEGETQVAITASRNIEYRYLIQILDALRSDKDGDATIDLFPEFQLAVSK
ncbi:MAG: biopolymer transporter ExbD [Polyangiaceae bacterium]|jgi:biopolymer transport protein TolR|nr:biopolymer transporter ExbD [Polyangiaceae bacterium]